MNLIKAHQLEGAKQLPSEHFNQRPDCDDISLLVIHNISLPPEQFDNSYVEDFFCGKLDFKIHPYFETIKDLRVSAHLYIKRDGSVIQFVPFNQRAWHAGESNYCGKNNCNDFSIGIEMQGSDTQAYTKEQYICLADSLKSLIKQYPKLNRKALTGHSDISPGRKTDPGEFFDWQHLDILLDERLV